MNGKIQNLLKKAAAIAEFSEDKMSSIACANRKFRGEPEARKVFGELREKLFRIERWNADSGLSSFELFDETGNSIAKKAATVGDFIKLTIAGSGKSDWLKIVNIDETETETVLTVQPSYNPTETEPDKRVTSHFFTAESTNNFCLQICGDTLNVFVIGLDEKSNTEATSNFVESARNVATANVGHYLGIQKAEWTTFCENFLETAPEK